MDIDRKSIREAVGYIVRKRLNGSVPGAHTVKTMVELDRFENCGSTFVCKECKKCAHKFGLPYRCKSRICPTCAAAYARSIRKRMVKTIGPVASTKKRGYALALLTLTINPARWQNRMPGPQNLKLAYSQLSRLIKIYYSKYRGNLTRNNTVHENRKRWRGGGAVVVPEFGRNSNLHFHCIVYGPLTGQKELSAMWRKITGDSYIVDVRAVRGAGVELASHILKYITKPAQGDSILDQANMILFLKGSRRFRAYGVFYNQIGPEKKDSTKLYCLFCGSTEFRFAGIGPDPKFWLIDWLAMVKYTDYDQKRFIREPLSVAKDKSWTPDYDWGF